jgi:putative aldouronate transport system substrate-binding protein
MIKFKKVLCLIVVLSLVLSLGLAGCSKDSDDEGTTTQGTTPKNTTKQDESKKETEEELKPVELIWHFPFGQAQPDQDKVFAEVNKIVKEEINATVKFNQMDFGVFQERIPVLIASGEPADLIWTASWANDYLQNVAKSAFLPLDELLEKYGHSLLQDIPKPIWDATRVKGKIYTIPNYQISAKTEPLMFKKDLVEKYNFDINSVKELEDLSPFLKDVKENEDGIYPIEHKGALWKCTMLHRGFEAIVNEQPGVVRYDDSEVKVINQFKTDEFKNYCELMSEWYEKGYIRKDAVSVTDTEPERKAGKYAIIIGGTVAYPGKNEADLGNKYGYKLKELIFSDTVFQTGSITATMTAVSQSSKNPERAVMLMNLLNNNEKATNLIAYGIEGEHYNKLDDGRIELVKESGFNHGWKWALVNSFKTYVMAPALADENDRILAMHEKAKPSPLIGFAFDAETVKTELAQCKSVIDEYFKGLSCGIVDTDKYLPEFLDKLEKAGASKLISEMQKQVDEFLKNK